VFELIEFFIDCSILHIANAVHFSKSNPCGFVVLNESFNYSKFCFI